MSILKNLLERRAIDASSFNLAIDVTPKTKSGEVVTFDRAVGVATAWACMTLIADTIYSLPVDVYTRRSDGTRSEIDPPPPLVAAPSLVVSSREWRQQATMSMLGWGNAYGIVVDRDRALRPTAVEWVNPDDVSVEQDSALTPPRYLVGGTEVPRESIVHLRRFTRPGSAVGMAPLARQRETLGLAIAVRNFVAQWFGEGAHPSAILQAESDIDEVRAKEAKSRFLQAIRGKREPAVLGKTWKYQVVQASPQDSDTAALAMQVALDVCMAFRMPPEMIGIASKGSSVTYANREQRSIDFLTYTIQPWLTVFEDWWTANLPRPQFAKFNTGALLRTDLLTRYRAHDLAIRMGLASPNERRRLEDMPPLENGDQVLWPPYRNQLDPRDEEPEA